MTVDQSFENIVEALEVVFFSIVLDFVSFPPVKSREASSLPWLQS